MHHPIISKKYQPKICPFYFFELEGSIQNCYFSSIFQPDFKISEAPGDWMRSRNFSRCVPRSRNGTSLYAFMKWPQGSRCAGIGVPEAMGKSSADAIRMVLEEESLHVPNKNDPVLVGKYSSTMEHMGIGSQP